MFLKDAGLAVSPSLVPDHLAISGTWLVLGMFRLSKGNKRVQDTRTLGHFWARSNIISGLSEALLGGLGPSLLH